MSSPSNPELAKLVPEGARQGPVGVLITGSKQMVNITTNNSLPSAGADGLQAGCNSVNSESLSHPVKQPSGTISWSPNLSWGQHCRVLGWIMA